MKVAARYVAVGPDTFRVELYCKQPARWSRKVREKVLRQAIVTDEDAAMRLADDWLVEFEEGGRCGTDNQTVS